MVPLTDLWLPIVLSAVFVFVVSSVVHMVLAVHKNDYRGLPGEAAVLAAMREQDVARGEYMFPFAGSMKELATPEMRQKFERGPVGVMSVMPVGPIRMGKALGLWFAYCLVIGGFVAWLAGRALAPGAEGVFAFTAVAAFLAHAFSSAHNSIWKGVSWITTAKYALDGLLYAIATAAAFAWLWPAAS